MTDDALRVLHRYQRWRKSEGVKGFEDMGFSVDEVSEALDHVLSELPVVRRALFSTQSQLAKCQVQRERFHAQLRSNARSQKP